MSKYEPLWKWIQEKDEDSFKLTFKEIKQITGVAVDHSFLKYKKELLAYGYQVGKISMKAESIAFDKIER